MNILKKIANTIQNLINRTKHQEPQVMPEQDSSSLAAEPIGEESIEAEAGPQEPEAESESAEGIADETQTKEADNSERITDMKLVIEEMKFSQVKLEQRCRVWDEMPMTLHRFVQRVLNINTEAVLSVNIFKIHPNGLDSDVEFVNTDELEKSDVMSIFMDSDKGEFNDVLRAVISIEVRVIDGAAKIISVLEPTSFHRQGVAYSSVRVSSLYPTGPGRHRSEVVFFSYISKPNWDLIHDISRRRNEAYLQDMWHYKVSNVGTIMMGVFFPGIAIGRAEELKALGYKTQPFYYYQKAQSLLNNQIVLQGGNKEDRELLADSALNVAECLLTENKYANAQYFFQKAQDISSEHDDASYLLEQCQRLEADEAMKYEGLALLLHTCLGFDYDDVKEAVFINSNGDILHTSKKESILEANLIKEAESIPPNSSCTLMYLLKSGHIIVLEGRHMANGSVMVSIMKPASLDSDSETKEYYDNVNLREYPTLISFSFSVRGGFRENDFKELRDKACRKAIDGQRLGVEEENALGSHALQHYQFLQGVAHEGAGRTGSALISYLTAYYGLLSKSAVEQLDKYDRKTLNNACYKIGYMLNELKLYNLAISFLHRVKDKELFFKAEYISALINNRDVRTLNVIDNAIENEKNDQEFINYMRRSRAQFLIMAGDPQNAKKALNPLLVDSNKLNYQFAHNAMQYLLNLYPPKN